MTPGAREATAGGLARTAVRLRLALLRGSLRSGPGSTARQIGFVLGAVFGGGLALGALAGLTAVRGSGRLAEDLAVLLFTALLAGWVVLPVLTFGSDDLLDPARLALLPLTRRQLLTVMGVGALIGVAPAATAVAALGLLPATARGAGSAVVAVLAVALLLALCVATSRAVAAALSGLLRSRRGRDLGVLLAATVGLSLQLVNPLLQTLQRRGGDPAGSLRALAGPLRWTPPGLLASAPGRPLPEAVAALLAVAGLLALVLLWWQRSVRRSLERPDTSGPRRRRSTPLVPRGLPLPAGRTGADVAKDLRYLAREPRRLVSAVIGVLLPVLVVVLGPLALSDGGPGPGLVYAIVGAGLLAGAAGSNRFGLDGTATWLYVATATDARDARRDLLGGDLAAAVVTVPTLLVVGVLLAAWTGGWSHLPPAVGTALAVFAVAGALSGLLAVHAPYPVPETQGFSSGGAGQGCSAGLLLLLSLLTATVACLPVLLLLVPALRSEAYGGALGLALLVAGPAYGLAVGTVLRRVAARHWARRQPEVLQVLAQSS